MKLHGTLTGERMRRFYVAVGLALGVLASVATLVVDALHR